MLGIAVVILVVIAYNSFYRSSTWHGDTAVSSSPAIAGLYVAKRGIQDMHWLVSCPFIDIGGLAQRGNIITRFSQHRLNIIDGYGG